MSDFEIIGYKIEELEAGLDTSDWHLVHDTKEDNYAIVLTDEKTDNGKMESAAKKALKELEE